MFESPYTGRDFVQFGKTESVLNKRAKKIALLFNPPPVLSLETIVYYVIPQKYRYIVIFTGSYVLLAVLRKKFVHINTVSLQCCAESGIFGVNGNNFRLFPLYLQNPFFSFGL